MMETEYLKARLDGVRFAVPAAEVLKILSEPAAIPMPDAPEGICGLVYDEGAVFPIRSICPERRSPAQLVILCTRSAGCAACAAERVETMAPLDAAERERAIPFRDTEILLLDKDGTA